MDVVTEAQELSRRWLARVLPDRWTHVQMVAAKAVQVGDVLNDADRRALIAAAWLHDVGYSPDLVDTGFHPLDGTRWLGHQGFDARTTALVAHHSCAAIEAAERGFAAALAEFANESSEVTDALLYCDLTTGPVGQDLPVAERLAEIRARYGPDHVVTRFVDHAEAEMLAAVQRVQVRLARAGQPM